MALRISSVGESKPPMQQSKTFQAPQSYNEPQEESGILPASLQRLGGYAARGGESLLGLPGNIIEGARSVGNLVNDFIPEPPVRIPKPKSPLLTGAKYITNKFDPELAEKIPTSFEDISWPTEETFHNITKSLTGEQLEPKTNADKHIQEFVQTIVPMIATQTPAKAATAIAGVGQGAKWLSEYLPIPEWGREGVKTGTMLLTSLVGLPTVEKVATDLYNKVEAGIQSQAPISRKQLMPYVNKMRDTIDPFSFPKKDVVINNLDAIEKAFKEGQSIPREEVWKLKKFANEWLRRPEIFHTTEAKRKIGDIADHLSKILVSDNPELGLADQLWRSLKASEDGAKFTNSALGDLGKKISTATLAFVANLLPGGSTLKGAGAIGAGLYKGLQGGYNLVQEVSKNPGLQHYYKELMKSILGRNKVQFTKQVMKLDKYLHNHPIEEKKSSGRYKITKL